MSLSLLHRRTGIGVSHLCNFRHGRRSVSLRSLSAIAAALGMGVELFPLIPAAQDAPGRAADPSAKV